MVQSHGTICSCDFAKPPPGSPKAKAASKRKEIYQRLEGLLGAKLPVFPTEEQTVLIMLERVLEAQRIATRELREIMQAKGKKKKGGKRGLLDEEEANAGYTKQLDLVGGGGRGGGGGGGKKRKKRQ